MNRPHDKSIIRKNSDFSEWYTNVITKSELISYHDVSGCYCLLPTSYSIWEEIQKFLDTEIKKLGVQNVYFPMFVTKKALEVEEDHIEDFSPEVAWVTKSGSSDLNEPIAIRPTSETIIYPYFAKKIKSHYDLPLKYNQWTNVVRWEFKNPTPFLRTREFLWQEGHTAHETVLDADREVFQVLELYRRVYEELLAVPVMKGYKSEKEKFAGARFTTTVEGFIPGSSKAIQGATSHSLGQNFAKMCNITFEGKETDDVEHKEKIKVQIKALEKTNKEFKTKMKSLNKELKHINIDMTDLQEDLVTLEQSVSGGDIDEISAEFTSTKEKLDKLKESMIQKQKEITELGIEFGKSKKEHSDLKKQSSNKSRTHHVWQNSWGLTTRTIGVMVMTHSDDLGLVLPPRIAPTQVVIVIIDPSQKATNREEIVSELERTANNIVTSLKKLGVRIIIDRTPNTHGYKWKYSYWELKGIPLRIELGTRDLEKKSVIVTERTNQSKQIIPWNNLDKKIPELLDSIQKQLYEKANTEFKNSIRIATTWVQFLQHVNHGFMVLAPWCKTVESEEWIRENTTDENTGSVKSLCIPFDQLDIPEHQVCVTGNGQKAKRWCLFGRSY